MNPDSEKKLLAARVLLVIDIIAAGFPILVILIFMMTNISPSVKIENSLIVIAPILTFLGIYSIFCGTRILNLNKRLGRTLIILPICSYLLNMVLVIGLLSGLA